LRIGVTSLGVSILPETFTRILQDGGYEAQFYPYTKKEGYSKVPFKDLDVLWHVGAFFNFDILFDTVKAKKPSLKTVLWWVGTDILNVASFIRARPKCRECLFRNIDIHVVDCIDFVSELKEKLGIEDAWFVPSIPEKPMSVMPLPPSDMFTVASYIPPHRTNFYGYPIIIEVARQMPDVWFHLFPSKAIRWNPKVKPPLPNVRFMPFVEGDEKVEAWSRCSAFISIPVHGGVSLMLIEFMQMGRRCISNKKLPHVFYVDEPPTPDKIIPKLKEIMKFKEPDTKASKYYHEEYSPKKVLEHVKPILERVESG